LFIITILQRDRRISDVWLLLREMSHIKSESDALLAVAE
jgi:hypothetical protein